MTVTSQRTVVITGVEGFVGQHTARAARRAGFHVLGIGHGSNVPHALAETLDEYIFADLTTEWPLRNRPDAVIHLAGLAAVGPSFDQPQHYINANSSMVTTMCEALIDQSGGTPATRVIGVSTGAVYASPIDDAPLDETSPTAETSPYVVSKLLVEHQLAYYARRGLDTIVARPFNHIGPGQSRGFLVPDLVARIRESVPGRLLTVGNLHTHRDYTDVRDVARAYVTLAAASTHAHAVYNVASGVTRSGAEVLDMICATLGRAVPGTRTDPALLRPNDAVSIRGDSRRLSAEFGWSPFYQLGDTISDFLTAQLPSGLASPQ